VQRVWFPLLGVLIRFPQLHAQGTPPPPVVVQTLATTDRMGAAFAAPDHERARHSTAEEQLVVTELSKVRLHPKEYAKWLRTQLKYFEGTLWHLPDHVAIRTEEGAPALQELIAFLESTPTIGPLRWNEGLSHAARELVLEQGPTGQTGHKGPHGSVMRDRILKFGLHQSLIGEIINYGDEKPRWTVMQLLIDDGVAGRGHRKNIFNPDFHVAGAAIGPHKEYGTMTVVDLADGYTSNPELQER
jgi:uncharacterized protein YkwD